MSNGSSFWSEFKAFLVQGNVIDLATAVIIGGAFGKIVESLMNDVITPAILSPVLKTAGVDNIAAWSLNGILLGKFIAAVLNFVVIALVIFTLLKSVATAKKKMERNKAVAEAEAAAADPALEVQQRLAESLERLTQVISSK